MRPESTLVGVRRTFGSNVGDFNSDNLKGPLIMVVHDAYNCSGNHGDFFHVKIDYGRSTPDSTSFGIQYHKSC